jgi:PEP-CTERM motif
MCRMNFHQPSRAARLSLPFAFAVLALPAFAGTVTAPDGVGGTAVAVPGILGATVTFSAASDAATTSNPALLANKTVAGYTGLGVRANRHDREPEIQIGERLTATFGGTASGTGLVVTALRLGFLFDGPEFGDVQEVAKITATFANGSTASNMLTFRALRDPSNPASRFGTNDWGATYSLISPTTSSAAGVWDILNPFGSNLVTSLTFTALRGTCAGLHCSNQSDYSLIQVTAVPEPATVALMAAGLGVVGWAARRRKAAVAGGEA